MGVLDEENVEQVGALCPMCGQGVLPVAVDETRSYLICDYICGDCGWTWSVGWS
jgi:ribosomal protein S27AE